MFHRNRVAILAWETRASSLIANMLKLCRRAFFQCHSQASRIFSHSSNGSSSSVSARFMASDGGGGEVKDRRIGLIGMGHVGEHS